MPREVLYVFKLFFIISFLFFEIIIHKFLFFLSFLVVDVIKWMGEKPMRPQPYTYDTFVWLMVYHLPKDAVMELYIQDPNK